MTHTMSLSLCGKILTVDRSDVLTNTEPFGPFRVFAVGSVCRVQSPEGRYHLCYLCLGEFLAGKQDHNQKACA